MTDQTTPQDPTEQYRDPEEQSGETIAHPGITSDMPEQPDHGEESYRGYGRLEGKRAIITGGDSGIGRAVAIAFAREGADVLISYLPEEEEDAQITAGHVTEAGRKAVCVPGDIRSEEHCQEIVDRAVSELGGVDILVNNAAYQMSQSQSILELTTDQLDRVMKTNIYAMVWLTKAALQHMQPGASIINTSSIQAYDPSPELVDYAMTKAAIVNFTKSMGQFLVEKGIRVNTVAPGPIWTPLIPATMPEGKVDSFGGQTAMGRAGQPAELAPAFVFFASQESSYITGERLGVAGGQPMP